MSVYLVSYELRTETSSADYQPLWDALNAMTSHKVQRSVWLVSSNKTSGGVHSHLKQFMDDDDRLWVSEVSSSKYAYSGAMAGTKKFLADNL